MNTYTIAFDNLQYKTSLIIHLQKNGYNLSNISYDNENLYLTFPDEKDQSTLESCISQYIDIPLVTLKKTENIFSGNMYFTEIEYKSLFSFHCFEDYISLECQLIPTGSYSVKLYNLTTHTVLKELTGLTENHFEINYLEIQPHSVIEISFKTTGNFILTNIVVNCYH